MSNAQQVTYDDIDRVTTLIEHQLMRYMTKNDIVAVLSENHNIEPKLTEIVWEQLEMENMEFFRAYSLRVTLFQQINWFNELLGQQAKLMSDINSESTRIPTPSGPQSSSMAPFGPGPSMNFQQANLTMPHSVRASLVQPLMQQGSSNVGGHSVMTDVLIPNVDPRLGLMHPSATFSEMRAPFPETSGSPLFPGPSVNRQELNYPACFCDIGDSRDVLESHINIVHKSGLLGAGIGRFGSSDIRADVTASHGNLINLNKTPKKIRKPTLKQHTVNKIAFRNAVLKYTRCPAHGLSTPPLTVKDIRPADANSQQQGVLVATGHPTGTQTMSNTGESIIQQRTPGDVLERNTGRKHVY